MFLLSIESMTIIVLIVLIFYFYLSYLTTIDLVLNKNSILHWILISCCDYIILVVKEQF